MLRLNKYIAQSGICSRRNADELIDNRRVSVNNRIITEKGIMVDELKDEVKVDNKIIKINNKNIYLMLNKPKGYITTSNEQFDRPCVIDLINEDIRVFPVGRLDMDTEGLLLLTNDGDFSNRLMHPKNKCKKVYVAKVKGKITQDVINKLCNGVKIEDYISSPAEVIKLDDNTLQITISEGKNRQVRKMCEAVNLIVTNLKRIKIGGLELGNLELGKYIKLNKKQIDRFF
jgi:23S rRNA pseudouridine2605 synthase